MLYDYNMFRKITNKNHILSYDNLLSEIECQNISDWFLQHKSIQKEVDRVGYHYADYDNTEPRAKELLPMFRAVNRIQEEYAHRNPEINVIPNKCVMPGVRFKWWKPGGAYSSWHCEHTYKFNNRVMNFMIYLSTNNCSTEFYRYGNYKTTAGRGIMFPSFYTHTHRGTPCKDNKDRYALSGYFFLTEELQNSDSQKYL